MRYSGVIFDFDGTLLYTLSDLAGAVNYALSKHGYPIHSEKKIMRMVGNGVNMLVARALPQGFDTPDYEKIMDDFRSFYGRHCMDNTEAYEGVPELLKKLRAEGCLLAIATNKYEAAADKLRERFFGETVEVLAGDLPGRAKKPAPDAIFAVLDRLGLKAGDCVYIGDTEIDAKTAENAGLDSICVSWGYRTREELEQMGIGKIADTPEQLFEMLR